MMLRAARLSYSVPVLPPRCSGGKVTDKQKPAGRSIQRAFHNWLRGRAMAESDMEENDVCSIL